MNNISPRPMILDLSTLVLLDNAPPEKLLQLYESTGSQDITTAAVQHVARLPEVFAQHQVQASNLHVGPSYRLSHYDPPGSEGQMNKYLNKVQEPSVIRRSPLPVYAGLPSFNQQERMGNRLCCAINHNTPERRVTSYPPDHPMEASPTEQVLKNTRRTIITTALRRKILSRKSGKSAGITADAGNIPVSGSCVKIARGTAPSRYRISTRSSVKANRANEQHAFR